MVFLGNRQLELREFPDPTPGPGEVVLEIKASGMCGSDLKLYRATGDGAAALGLPSTGRPIIAGHEPCGVIAAVGPGVPRNEAQVGQRVMNHHYWGCGVCKHCRVGWSQLCPGGMVSYGVTGDGAHAHYMKVPARTNVPLPEELSFEEGSSIACGTGAAYGGLRRLALTGGETLAVYGQGPVGLSATMLGVAMGARVIAIDISPERLTLARELGADVIINPEDVDPLDAIREATRGEGAEAVLDTTGVAEARLAGVRCAATWGRVCFVGEGGSVSLEVSKDMIRKQLTVMGNWTFSSVWQMELARFVVERKIPLRRLLTHRFKLEQAPEAYKLFDTQSTGKGVFVF